MPTAIPNSPSLSASPPINTGPPNELSSAPELVPSLKICNFRSTAFAVIPGILSPMIVDATSLTVSELLTVTLVPFIVIAAVPANDGLDAVPVIVGHDLIQASLPTSTQAPFVFL